METRDTDQAGAPGSDPISTVLSTTDATENAATSPDPSVAGGASSHKASADKSPDVNIPESASTTPAQTPRELLGPHATQDPFPMEGKTYALKDPKRGGILAHTKRKFFLVSPADSLEDDVHWQWSFKDITGDGSMMRLMSPWLEAGGSRWILLDVTRRSADGKVVVSVDMDMKWPAGQKQPTFKNAYIDEDWKQQRDGPIKILEEAQWGNFAVRELGKAIGWEFIRVE
ncbi:hypothetical protein QBC40DRAFT_318529 [Triangularia verruculosa]|uniref:Uncharacterized protein n=1 Tax=Triangularia verruculosa TaxID=2587418 RepID=A0AAN6XP48_9PEZI|nr:hypothetical protein QBC40DRAFT_318529 [Triangularia verruculosa]